MNNPFYEKFFVDKDYPEVIAHLQVAQPKLEATGRNSYGIDLQIYNSYRSNRVDLVQGKTMYDYLMRKLSEGLVDEKIDHQGKPYITTT